MGVWKPATAENYAVHIIMTGEPILHQAEVIVA